MKKRNKCKGLRRNSKPDDHCDNTKHPTSWIEKAVYETRNQCGHRVVAI